LAKIVANSFYANEYAKRLIFSFFAEWRTFENKKCSVIIVDL